MYIERSISDVDDKGFKAFLETLSEAGAEKVIEAVNAIAATEAAGIAKGHSLLTQNIIIWKQQASELPGVSFDRPFVEAGDAVILADGRTNAVVLYAIKPEDLLSIFKGV